MRLVHCRHAQEAMLNLYTQPLYVATVRSGCNTFLRPGVPASLRGFIWNHQARIFYYSASCEVSLILVLCCLDRVDLGVTKFSIAGSEVTLE